MVALKTGHRRGKCSVGATNLLKKKGNNNRKKKETKRKKGGERSGTFTENAFEGKAAGSRRGISGARPKTKKGLGREASVGKMREKQSRACQKRGPPKSRDHGGGRGSL